MKLNQRRIHEEQNSLGKHFAPPIGEMVKDKKISHKLAKKIKNFFIARKGLLTVSAVIMLWGTIGEFVLDHPYRLSTIKALIVGRYISEEIRTVLPAEATKQEVVTGAGAAVDLKKNCHLNASNTFASCIARGGTLPVCEYKHQAALEPCQGLSAGTLVEDYQRKTNEGVTP